MEVDQRKAVENETSIGVNTMNTNQSIAGNGSQVEVLDCELEQSIINDKECPATMPSRKNEVKPKPQNTKTLQEPTAAYKVFEQSLKFFGMFGNLIGTNMNFEWKRNPRFYFSKILEKSFWILITYTQLLRVYQNDAKRTLEQFALYGIGISIMLKGYCYEKYYKHITALFNSTYKICQENSGRRGEILHKRMLANHSFYKFLCILSVAVGIMYILYPIKSFIIDHQLVPIVPIEIMFIDQSTKSGYVLGSIIFMTFAAFGISVIAYVALSFDIAIMNYAPRVDLVEYDFEELDALWSHPSTSTVEHRRFLMRNICRKINDMRSYIDEIKTIYEPQLFLYFSVTYVSQIICLYQARVNNWMAGYTFVIGNCLEMIFYCLMGTKITIENERLFYIITQSKWYTYDGYSQSLILNLLTATMIDQELWIGPLKPLNVLTASQIMKSIYSYYTIMAEIL